MPRPAAPAPTFLRLLVAAGLGLASAGCASRVVDVTEPAGNERRVASEQPSYDGEYRPSAPPEDRPGRYGDPRQMRTADGRPAPYGRDLDTGRAINDPLPPPRPLPPRTASAALPPPAAVGARPAQPQPAPAVARSSGTSVVVAKGDTLHSLARRHSLKVEDIKRANGLTTDQIKIGQKLTIPGA